MNAVKKIVRCRLHNDLPVKVGERAYINTYDHPNLSNRQMEEGNITITSAVTAINEDGSFETQNTLYRPVQQLNG
jgi:hypothetical protein